jgi:hypothetical protein
MQALKNVCLYEKCQNNEHINLDERHKNPPKIDAFELAIVGIGKFSFHSSR